MKAFVLPIILASFFLWCPAAPAEPLPPLFLQAAQAHNVPLDWTQAIARVESGWSPFVLNIEGKGYIFASKDEALAKARQAQAEGRSFDSGLMQINSRWLDRYSIPLEAALDPAANVWLGSWILKQEIERYGRNWSAVAHYHSPDPARGQRYVEQVKAALERGPVKERKQTARAAVPVPAPAQVPEQHESKDKKEDSFVIHRRTEGEVFARVQEDQELETGAFIRRANSRL